jgi:hypothetical protein
MGHANFAFINYEKSMDWEVGFRVWPGKTEAQTAIFSLLFLFEKKKLPVLPRSYGALPRFA